jgi:hypothetical protein
VSSARVGQKCYVMYCCIGGLHDHETVAIGGGGQKKAITEAAQACDGELGQTAHARVDRLVLAQLATTGAHDRQHTLCVSRTLGGSQPQCADSAAVIQPKDAQVREDVLEEVDWQLRHGAS